MKLWPIAVIGLSCLLLSGCRTDPAIQLLERDNRRLEDEIYRLRACLDDYQSGMIASETETVNTKPHRRDRTEESDSSSHNSDLPPGASTRIRASKATSRSPKTKSRESPAVRIPLPRAGRRRPTGPALSIRRATRGRCRALTRPVPHCAEHRTKIRFRPACPPKIRRTSRRPRAIATKRCRSCCTTNSVRPAKPTGCASSSSARDRRDRRINAPAAVSVVLIDPTLVPRSGITPPEARIARWDYPADAVASMFRRVGSGNAIYIEAPWPDKAAGAEALALVRALHDPRWTQVAEREGRSHRHPTARRPHDPPADAPNACSPPWRNPPGRFWRKKSRPFDGIATRPRPPTWPPLPRKIATIRPAPQPACNGRCGRRNDDRTWVLGLGS